jgi:LPS export ABC transporter protein LptC
MKKHISVYVAILSCFIIACSNDLDDIRKVTVTDNFPDQTATDLRMVNTDSGKVQFSVKAKIMETVNKPAPMTYLKDGLEVVFFDKQGNKEAILTAYYGERNETSGEMFVRDSVVLVNLKEEQQLETEELFWKNDSVFSNKSVIVRTKDATLFGKGISADQTFTIFNIKHPTGKREIKD